MPDTGKINGQTPEGLPDPSLVREIGLLRALLETRLNSMDKAIDSLFARNVNLPQDVRVLQSQIEAIQVDFDRRIKSQDTNVSLALTAAEKTTAIAQATADKAVVKAEAAASREYLEAQINALSNVTTANMVSQKEAINAALTAAKEALTAALAASEKALIAALASSEKAITKAEEANEKRFASVNEFRATLADQQRELATKSEVSLRFNAIEDKLATAISTLDVNRGKGAALSTVWAMVIGGVGIIIAAVTLINLFFSR